MTKIIWLNNVKLKEDKDDKTPWAIIGGAELTISKHMEYLKSKGHNVEWTTPFDFSRKKIDEADLVILSNVIWGNRADQFNHSDLDYVIKTKPFVNLSHDAQYCKFRNPDCSGLPKIESVKCQSKLCRDSVRLHWWRKAFKDSKLNIFLSPLQVKDAKFFFWKELDDDRTVCIPPCIKKNNMKHSKDAVIKGTYCVVGAIYPGKGIDDILDNYAELGKNLRFIGSRNHAGLVKRIMQQGHTLVDPVTYDEMPNILNKYEHAIISRRIKLTDNMGRPIQDEKGNQLFTYMKEAFSRVIMELVNIGVNIIVDKDSKKIIGYYSWNLSDDEMSKMCDIADMTFYSTLQDRGLLK